MSLTPEIEAKGLKAYEQMRAFEQLKRRRWPLVYGTFLMTWLIFTLVLLRNEDTRLIITDLIGIGLFAFVGWCHWQGLKERYARNVELLAELKKTYGDELPWVKVENHFAELEQLKQDLEKELKGPL